MTTTPNKTARLTPLTGEEYSQLDAQHRQHDLATCPCCNESTTQGWLDDQGCCYSCSTYFDRPARRTAPPVAEVRFVTRNGRLFLTGILD
jgi:hypothetical protein